MVPATHTDTGFQPTVLTMELRDRAGAWVSASLDLDAIVDNQNGCLVFETPPSAAAAAATEAPPTLREGEILQPIEPRSVW